MTEDEHPAPVPGPVELRDEPDEGHGLSPLVKIGLVVGALGAACLILVFGSDASDAFVYAKLVDEVLVDPEAFRDRELRVEGALKQGSVQFAEEPCEWRFVLSKGAREMPVRFPQCIVPDTFKDGMGLQVTVQGRLTDEGYFAANQVIPRCPSKYEMQQAQARGESMPHEMPASATQ
jgi:cytochrome c-type biogenesis protein CcmE